MNATGIRRPARALTVAVGMLALLFATPVHTSAQDGTYRISQRATVSQKLGNTLVSLDYSRPLMRDRADVFGKVIHWGELWTPGANEATVLEVSDDVKLNGHDVPAGRWSMWVIPSQVGPWEMVLDPTDSLFHTQRPELSDEQIRFVIEDEHDGPYTEALAWSFPSIAQDGGTVRMNWGNLQIDMDVAVTSVEPVTTVAAEEAALYVGEWLIRPQMGPPGGELPPPMPLTIRLEEGRLFASFPPGAFAPPPGPEPEPVDESAMSPQERERAHARQVLAEMEQGPFEYLLVPRARGIFMMGWFDDGVLLDVEEFYHEFEFVDGNAVSITIRGADDEIMGKGTRQND